MRVAVAFMKIVAYNLPKRLSLILQQRFGKKLTKLVKLIIHDKKLTEKTADQKAQVMVVTIASLVNAKILKSMKNLKTIITASTGTNHIDLAECKKLGIEVKNCPGYGSNGVAELAIALAFSGLRKMNKMLEFGRNLNYPKSFFYYLGSELSGKTCTVLGTGSIGALIAKKLIALGAKVNAYSRSIDQELADLGVKYVTFGNAIRKAEIIFIALPFTKETFHIIGAKELLKMKKGSSIVNIARGELVDSDGLLKHIGRLSFVATDVIEGESGLWFGRTKTIHAINELVKKDNFLLVPHIGSSTSEAQERLAEEIITALGNILR
ncbi:NAD(P)-binding domain-containing protein [Candidatus Micrarchaeota archaeon]|nr:NAD(P)-binding domain-containing protein [Candidatus Micrarchaeota archaeon]